MIPLKDNLSCKGFPRTTLILIVLNMIGFAIELLLPAGQVDAFMMKWMVVPANITHALGSGSIAAIAMALLTMVTASFLHGGWMHIIGNMVFLQAFGRAVEARLGSLRFALFYLLGCFAAWGLFFFSDPNSLTPALGASGAIAAVLGAYLVFFPKAEFKTLMFVGPLPLLVVIRAWMLLIVWFGLQLISGYGAVMHPAGGGGVAYWAHIGGFVFGMIVAGVMALRNPSAGACYTPMSCDCTCSGGSCQKKNHKHRFQFLWLRLGTSNNGCDHNHNH